MIKAIIFDIDGVLLDSYEANFKFFQDLMEKTGYPDRPNREEFSGLFHLSMHDAIKEITQLEDEKAIKRIWEMGERRDVSYNLELLKMPEGCEKTLIELSKKYRLAIVTSRIRNSVYESPLLSRLENLFKVAVSFEDTDSHKPHPDPLLLVAKKLGLKSEECVYVGDVESDVKAANAANMKVVLYSNVKIEGADAHTSKFIELPQIIEKL